MVASLDQFRRQFPPLASMKDIQRYLKEQLVISGAKTIGDIKWEPAGVVDPERLVTLNAKSVLSILFIKHLILCKTSSLFLNGFNIAYLKLDCEMRGSLRLDGDRVITS